jgi:hypothetical protein
LPVKTTVTEGSLATCIREEFVQVWTGPGGVCLCALDRVIEEVDEFHEAWTCSLEIADSFADICVWFEGFAVRWHQDADVTCAAAADVKAREVIFGSGVVDSMPVLLCGCAAWTGSCPWGWAGHLVEEF